MPKKVLQDITSRDPSLKKKKFTRKWDYSDKAKGIVNTGKQTTKAIYNKGDVEEDAQEDIFGIEEENPVADHALEEESVAPQYYEDDDLATGSKKKKLISVSLVLLLIIGFFVISNMMSSATVDITPLQQTVSLTDEEFTVKKNGIDHTFQMQIINDRQSVNVAAVNEEDVLEKATGQIVVYNEYDNEPFRLIANTRFQSPDGKVYRIAGAISIPGYKLIDGEVVPGSLEVTVTADQPGEEFNVGLVDFTIPGLKTLQDKEIYQKVYARSKTSMTGGYDGILRSAAPEDVEAAEKTLEKNLRDALMEEIESTISNDKVLYDDAIFTRFESKTLNADDVANVTVEGQMMLYAVTFNKRDLSASIAEEMLSSYDGSTVIDRNIEELSFTFIDKENFDFVNDETFTFTLTGQSHLVWETDEEALKSELAGSRLAGDQFEAIVKKHSSIRKAVPDVSPFWKRTFPSDPEDIVIQESLK